MLNKKNGGNIMYKILVKEDNGWKFITNGNASYSPDVAKFGSIDEAIKRVDDLLDSYNKSELKIVREIDFDVKVSKR